MSKFLKVSVALAIALSGSNVLAETGKLGLGRAALPTEIAAWDLDVRPDGTGLPVGSGDAITGETLFEDSCAICHGSFAEGVDNWPKLAGGEGTLADEDPLKTVGSYFPYLSTVWDYVNRSMPFGNAQSLSPDEVYAITAYILYSNDLIEDDFVLSNVTFHEVEMPNADGFVVDDRSKTEYSIWNGEPCMIACKSSVEITMRARVLDVTPGDETENAIAATDSDQVAKPAVTVATVDPELIAAGEKIFRKCKSCHQVGEKAKNRSGPILNGIMGRAVGAVDGFRYSKAFKTLAESGLVWDEATLSEFLSNPKKFVKGTKMSFRGLKKDEDLAAIAAYLATFAE